MARPSGGLEESRVELDAYINDARILVVDDERGHIALLSAMLRKEGYVDVHTLTDPTEVLPLVRQSEPDIVLLDLHMPKLDGFAVLEQVQSVLPEGAFVPVVVLTADVTDVTRKQAL